MKNSIKFLLMSAIALSASNSLFCMQREDSSDVTRLGLRHGQLIINNTLNEPIEYSVAYEDHRRDKTGKIETSVASLVGRIRPNAKSKLSSAAVKPDEWGWVIYLELRRLNAADEVVDQIAREIHDLGAYTLSIDRDGHLALE